ncbi:MAG: NAD(+) synthase [Myxococcales bacterium]|nr:NAD(+) synthase [Myxococcales bacterium]
MLMDEAGTGGAAAGRLEEPQLAATLAALRARRGFDAGRCVQAKVALLLRYFEQSSLRAAVVGVSGGVDSAVVLGLLARAAAAEGSPIRRVVAVLAPYTAIPQGASNQAAATARGREVARAFAAECVELDLSAAHAVLKSSIEDAVRLRGGAWADGQLVSNLRTPALYQVVTLLAQQGDPGLLVGTTNRDEGSYVGYFGKASDGLCDLQPIGDLHKSEVYALARALGVPDGVIAAAPTGDIWDGRTDAELIGVPYAAIELYTGLLCLADDERAALTGAWGEAARAAFSRDAARIEQLHRENGHKYHGGSPAVFLDVYARAVPDGWTEPTEPEESRTGSFVNPVALDPGAVERLAGRVDAGERAAERLPEYGDSALVVHALFDADECAQLLAAIGRHAWVPVGVDGILRNYDPEADTIGSWRLSTHDERLAGALWRRLAPHVPAVRVVDERTPTDVDDAPVWRAVGVNPLLRFIRYRAGGGLVPHYDSAFVASERRRTLMSVVVHLTGHASATRIIRDAQAGRPRREFDYADWTRYARADEVALALPSRAGSAVVIDHRVLHDSEPVTAGEKIVLRTDIFYRRCGPARGRVFPARMLGMPAEGRG